MPRSQESVLNAPEVQKAIEKEKELRLGQRVKDAERILSELEGQYEQAKHIFFQVNGARRILKNRA